MGKFFSNLLQNEPKKAILHIKNQTNKKNKSLSTDFLFQFQKKTFMDENIFIKKSK